MDVKVVLIWGAAISILLAVGMGALVASHSPTLDANFCQANGQLKGHTVILVDETDAYSPEQVEMLKTVIVDVRDTLSKYARLSVIPIGRELEEPPLASFSLCNPGHANQVNAIIETDQAKSAFDDPLAKLVASLEIQKTQSQSPILQTIAGVARLPNFQQGQRELDIVSDLLENSPLISQYRKSPSFTAFAASSDYSIAKANLSGVSVRLFYLKRPATESVQTQSQRQFWVSYFRASAAKDVSWCGVGVATENRREVTCEPASN